MVNLRYYKIILGEETVIRLIYRLITKHKFKYVQYYGFEFTDNKIIKLKKNIPSEVKLDVCNWWDIRYVKL